MITPHPTISIFWNYWPFYHFLFWFIRFPLNLLFFIPNLFSLPFAMMWNFMPATFETMMTYFVPASFTFMGLVGLMCFVLVFVLVVVMFWIMSTAAGLVVWAGFCVGALGVIVVGPLLLFVIWWVVLLVGSLVVWLPLSALFINFF